MVKDKSITVSKFANIPTIGKRILMTIIDWGILFLITLVFEIIPLIMILIYFQAISNYNFNLVKIMKIISWVITPLFSMGLIFAIFYYVVVYPIKHNGQTLGMGVTKAKMVIIIDEEKGVTRPLEKDDLKLSTKRFLWSILDFSFWGIVGLIAIWRNNNNQTLSEKFTKTLVIGEKEC